MTDRFQGDPKLSMTNNGAVLTFLGGQPVMDGGIENFINISLFTRPGWCGNDLFEQAQQIGSDFEASTEQAITLNSLVNIERSAQLALKSELFGDIEASASNPISSKINVEIILRPPGYDEQKLLLSRDGQKWIIQARSN